MVSPAVTVPVAGLHVWTGFVQLIVAPLRVQVDVSVKDPSAWALPSVQVLVPSGNVTARGVGGVVGVGGWAQ